MSKKSLKPIAFYLPQFYPNSENDNWWGKGFTEWTLVTQAKQLFKSHYQPQLPSDLGFYDLRLIETLEDQAKLAKESGLYGFMFYHYWFNGKRFLDKPVDNMLNTGKPDFPFCLCWANETWTRVWKGEPNEILQKQEYCAEDDEKHMRYLCEKVFCDSRYIKVNGKPLFGIWEIRELPNPKQTISIWQDIAREFAFPGLYIVSVDCLSYAKDPKLNNLDAVVEFVPDWQDLPEKRKVSVIHKILNLTKIYRSPYYDHRIMEYKDLAEKNINRPSPEFKYFPGITPSWDNTSRRKERNAHVFHNAKPEYFENWLKNIVTNYIPHSEEENFVFINAWNEWAEGAHLEPCHKYGTGYLDVVKKVIKNEV